MITEGTAVARAVALRNPTAADDLGKNVMSFMLAMLRGVWPMKQDGFRPNVISRQLAFVNIDEKFQAGKRQLLGRIQHWSPYRIPPTAREHCSGIICCRPCDTV